MTGSWIILTSFQSSKILSVSIETSSNASWASSMPTGQMSVKSLTLTINKLSSKNSFTLPKITRQNTLSSINVSISFLVISDERRFPPLSELYPLSSLVIINGKAAFVVGKTKSRLSLLLKLTYFLVSIPTIASSIMKNLSKSKFSKTTIGNGYLFLFLKKENVI
jgi:hypothetical protein